MNIRVTDPALYQRRLNDFDFDMTITAYANSESPGNEQYDYFGCEAAKIPGSRNLAGVCRPEVEKLLRHQYIIVPAWYADRYRVVYRNNLGIPQQLPKYYDPVFFSLSSGWWK